MRVLVPVDGSDQSWAALEYAAEQFGESTLVALDIVDPVEGAYGPELGGGVGGAEWFQAQKEVAEATLESATERAGEAGVDIETHREVGKPAKTIVEYADEEGFDHIVIGSHGREGIPRVLLGSVAETVVRRSSVPVTGVR